MKKTRPALIALTAALTLGITACGSDSTDDAADSTTASSSTASDAASTSTASTSTATSSASGSSSADSAGSKDVLAAIDAAAAKGGGTAYEIDDQDGDGSWEVDVAKGAKSLEVGVGEDGKATVEETDDLDDEDRAGVQAAKVTLGDAIETALKEVDGTFDGAELEEEGGQHFWEITIDDGTDDDREVRIDVTTGKVLPRNN